MVAEDAWLLAGGDGWVGQEDQEGAGTRRPGDGEYLYYLDCGDGFTDISYCMFKYVWFIK